MYEVTLWSVVQIGGGLSESLLLDAKDDCLNLVSNFGFFEVGYFVVV